MSSHIRLCCTAATMGALMSGAAFARTVDIGKAEVVVPDARSTSVEQEETLLQVGTDVFKDDVVKTGKIGAVMLQFTDKTTLKVYPNSTVKLDNYVYATDRSVVRVGLNLLSGAMRIASGGPHTADKYELRTPQATIGIRGTVIHIVAEGERTVVEALHGSFEACSTAVSACRTIAATEEMNALNLWSDGRMERARARRELGVRAAIGSSAVPDGAGPSTALAPPPASGGGADGRAGSETLQVLAAGLLRLDGPGFFSSSGASGGGSAQCFAAGTRILTPEGERAVETLRVGSPVVTRSGPARVRWIARQTFHRAAGRPWPAGVAPILIEPDALAPGMPCRPLVLSPAHSLFLDGVLVPAGRLVNGRTIRRIAPPGTVLRYYNVVLDTHAVIVAEGVPVETWQADDAHDQARWDNVAGFRARYPETCDAVVDRCAPLVPGRRQRVRDRIAALVALRRPPPDPAAVIRRRCAERARVAEATVKATDGAGRPA